MTPRLSIEDVARLLKTDDATVTALIGDGKLHGVRHSGIWSTTREILESDLELLTEAPRIERMKSGVKPVLPERHEAPVWLTGDWVTASLQRVRAAAQGE